MKNGARMLVNFSRQ